MTSTFGRPASTVATTMETTGVAGTDRLSKGACGLPMKKENKKMKKKEKKNGKERKWVPWVT